jgi:hypothetical protein
MELHCYYAMKIKPPFRGEGGRYFTVKKYELFPSGSIGFFRIFACAAFLYSTF